MDVPAGKKYLKLNEQQWEQVRAFVKKFFEQPEKASQAPYKSSFNDLYVAVGFLGEGWKEELRRVGITTFTASPALPLTTRSTVLGS